MAWLETPNKMIRNVMNSLTSPKLQPSPIATSLPSAEAPTAMEAAPAPKPALVAAAAQKKPKAKAAKDVKVKTEPERRALRVRTLKKGDLCFRNMERKSWKFQGKGTLEAPFVL